MTIVGFTGTRYGMTAAQWEAVDRLLGELFARELHHGDCVGADADAHAIAKKRQLRIVIHPPLQEEHRAFCRDADVIAPTKSHFARNRDIVERAAVLIATPYESEVQLRGGTWYTVGYARKVGRPVHVVWPDGSVGR